MKRILAVALAAALCAAFAGPALAGGQAARPFGGTMTGAVTYEEPSSCPLGFTTVTDTHGATLHLGWSAMHWEHCFTPPNQLVRGTLTITAANGDSVLAAYSGTTEPAMPENVGDVIVATFSGTITGGTGRFEGASGSFTGHGYITFPGWDAPAWPGHWDMRGTITY